MSALRRPIITPPGGWARLTAGILVSAALTGPASAAVGRLDLVSRGGPPSDAVGGFEYVVSADGRYVAFTSEAGNVVAGQVDVGGTTDVFLHDRTTGTATLVSRTFGSPVTAGNGTSFAPRLSADGRFVVFVSDATNLVAGLVVGDARGINVFLYDRTTGSMMLVSRAAGTIDTTANDSSTGPVISADGAFVAYSSWATNLVAGQVDTNFTTDVFLYERITATTTLVSRTPASAVTTGTGGSFGPVINAAGDIVAFVSGSPDLVSGNTDSNAANDVFLYDRVSQAVVLVSGTAAASATPGDGSSDSPAISADGAFVAFVSQATNLSPAQIEVESGTTDVFLYNRAAGTTTLVTHSKLSPITAAGLRSTSPRISNDGQFVAYESLGQSLATGTHGDDGPNVFLYDRLADTNTLLSSTPTARGFSRSPSISTNGLLVAFVSATPDLIPGQVDTVGFSLDVFLYDRLGGTTTLVSHAANAPLTVADAPAEGPIILSADGRFVAFRSLATDLVAGLADLNGSFDVFLYDRTADTALISRGDPSRRGASGAADSLQGRRQTQSADGQFVVLSSRAANLVPGQQDANHNDDVFLHDRLTRTTTLVSRTAAGEAANGRSLGGVISADGRFVAFVSLATDLVVGQVDLNEALDVFLFDRVTGTTTLVSHATGLPETTGTGESFLPTISADGQFVAFISLATNLVAGQQDANNDFDVFLFDRDTGTMVLVSRNQVSGSIAGNGLSDEPRISGDGRFVAFRSRAFDLVPGQGNGNPTEVDVFLYDRESDSTMLVSRQAGVPTTTAEGRSAPSAISTDGRFVLFTSAATNLVAGQQNPPLPDEVSVFDQTTGTDAVPEALPPSKVTDDVFLFDRTTETTALISRTLASPAQTGNGSSRAGDMSADGEFVVFVSEATDLGPDPSGPARNVFLHDRVTGTTTRVSRSLTGATAVGEGGSFSPVISADGRVVAFISVQPDLVAGQHDDNGAQNVFLYDRLSGTTLLASRTLRSRAAALAQVTADAHSTDPALNADGTVLVFNSLASDLTRDADLNGAFDVFVLDRICPDPPARLVSPCPNPAPRRPPP